MAELMAGRTDELVAEGIGELVAEGMGEVGRNILMSSKAPLTVD